jgi:multisubunit Na+/H+ antiporter MnhG subunit
MIKTKCVIVGSLMLLIASATIFEATNRSMYFMQIFGSLVIGSVIGMTLYWVSLYIGYKILTRLFEKPLNSSKIYFKIK